MILVTGGVGYVGCVLVSELLKRGKKVRVFDRLVFGNSFLDNIRNEVELVEGDIREFDPRHLEGVEAILHLAGISNDATAEYDPKQCYEINTVATEDLALACREGGVKKFIFASTCSVYDHEAVGNEGIFDENSSIFPQGHYAVSNNDAEKILEKLVNLDFCPAILRQGTIHGYSPRMRFDLVVNTFIKDAITKGTLRVLNGGLAWRPLVDVRDLACAYLRCLEVDERLIRGEIFNVAAENLRVIEIAEVVREVVQEVLGKEIRLEVDQQGIGTRSYRVSAQKIERRLGFRPQFFLRESVRDVIQKLQEVGLRDFTNPIYYNFRWMTHHPEKSRSPF